MGNEASSPAPLQSQDSNNPWTVLRKDAEDGEVCEFSHRLDGNIRDDLCKTALEHLRILRHPNVLKFLGSETSSERVVMMTEVVSPLASVSEKLHTEGVILGWKDILFALDFLHSRAKLSHNNLHVCCVYVSAVNSRWKVGGFEAAQLHTKMDATFLSSVAAYRHHKAVPPEDKVSAPKQEVPCHSRDIWACGQLILGLPNGAGGLGTTILRYVQEKMLNQDPLIRPSALTVSQQVWMKTAIGAIADFLAHLTLHCREDKEAFFGSLIERLRAQPPEMVAEHVIPLLITPLVVTETAGHPLWSAVFTTETPLATTGPHLATTEPPLATNEPPLATTEPPLATAALLLPSDASLHSIKPLFTQELFVAHVIPLLLNLMGSRDKQVRSLLLKYLGVFAPLCKDDDLRTIVLPEVLVGLRDSCDELVASTLHALGDLVPLIGSKAVVGSSGKPIFAGSLPRGKPVTMETSSVERSVSMETTEGAISANILSLSPPLSTTLPPPLSTTSSDAERSPSLSHSHSKHNSHSKHPDREHQRYRREQQKARVLVSLKLVTHASPQDSGNEPVLSGGDNPQQESDLSGGARDGLHPSSVCNQNHDNCKWKELYSHEDQSGICDDGGLSLDDEGESLDGEGESLDGEEMSLDEGKSHVDKSVNHRGGKGSTDDVIRGVGQDGGSQALASHRGQMSKEDRERLEQQAMWAREPDVFAELGMAPSVQPTPPTSLSIQNSRITTASLTYQAPTSEIVGEEWGEWEEWGSI